MHLFEKYISTLLTGAAFIVVAASDASAQQQSAGFLNAPATDQGLRLNFNTNSTYSDNLLRFSDIDIAERADLQPEDYVLDLSGNIAIGRKIGRNQLSFDSSVGYRFHDNNTQLDSERFSGRGVFAWQLGTLCTGGVGAQWLRDNGQFETQTDVLINNNQTTLAGGGQVQCRIVGPLQISGAAVLSRSDNSDPTRATNDREDQFYTGSLRYTFGRGSYLGALVSSSISDFTGRDDFIGAVDQFELFQYAGEASLVFGRGIQLTAQAGFTDIQNLSDFSSDLTGFSGSVNARVPVGTAHTINFSGSRSIVPLQSVTAIFARATDLSVVLSSSWSPKLSTRITAGYTQRLLENDDAIIDPNEGFNEQDDTYSFGAGVNYDLGRLIGLSLSYRYAKRTANVESFEFSSNSFLFGLSVKFR